MERIEAAETWTGPGKTDGVITPLAREENSAHPCDHRNYFEHWYFDARLDDGHVVVGFLQAAELISRKPGVELHVYRPDGVKLSVVKRYPASDVTVSESRCDVSIGENHCEDDFPPDGGFPSFHVRLAEEDMAFDLTFEGLMPGWKPGEGRTLYGETDFFAWVVPAPRARVRGTVRFGDRRLEASGVGYHDHNWGVGDMKRIVDHWYWGRVYADDLTMLYAYVMTRKRYGSACSTPVMLARGSEVILSTGEMRLESGGEVFNEAANRDYPAWVDIKVPGSLGLHLEVREVIDAHDFIADLPVLRSRALKPAVNRLVGRPGYFRFNSDYSLRVIHEGATCDRSGTTLHEMVALK